MPTLFDLYGIDLGQPDEPPPPPKSGLIRRAVGDTAVTAVKGSMLLPEMAVGLASLATGGRAGKAAEEAGFRPKEAREFLDTLYSPEQQAANREVQQAQGFIDTASAALRNPSTIFHAVVESAPSMLGAAGAARGIMAAAPRVNPLIAVGAGEGIFSAGSAAEQIRQQTDDGLLTGEQSLIAGTSGALTGLIGSVAGKIANKLGIGDVQQMLAGVQQAGPKAEKALTRALLEGFATEGVLQELPQSAQEQIAQNVALGKPWDEGVGNAAAMGTLAGGVMGVGGAAIGYRRSPQPAPADPIAESNAKASEAMDRLAAADNVKDMAKAASDLVESTPLSQGITPEQEARIMQAGEELAQADLTDIKNMGRLDRTRSPEPPAQPAPIIPASEEGPAPFLDRLLTATEALQDPAVRQRVQQAAGPQYLAQLDQYAEVANTPGVMDGVGDQVRERFLGLLERAVFPDRFRQPAPAVQRAERRKSDPVPIEPFRAPPVTDPVLDYVDAKRGENTPAARMFVKEFEAGRITRRDVVRVMQDRNADPLGSNPNPLAGIQPATPAPNLVQQRLEAAARAGQAQPTGIQIEPSRARPKEVSDERNPERAAPGEGRAVDAGSQPGTSGVVQGELQQPGAAGPAGAPVPSAVQGLAAERAGRGLGDDALSGAKANDKTSNDGFSGIRSLAEGETSLPQPKGQELPGVRGAGDQDARGLDQRLQRVSDGGGSQANAQSLSRQDRREKGLRTGQRALGNSNPAGAEQTGVRSDSRTGRQTNDRGRVVKGVGDSGDDDLSATGRGVGAREGVGARPQERRSEREASEDGRTGVAAENLGKKARDERDNDTRSTESGLERGEGAEPSGKKLGRIKVAGLDISIENPAGSERSGIDPDGKKWRNKLAHHYGYLRNTSGADGDHVDVFVNPGTPEDYDGMVFVVDQADPKTGRFDEHKVMMGFPSAKAAQEAYQANYAKDWTGLRAVQPMTMEQFKAWVSDPANTKKPAAKGVKPGKGEKVERPDELVELRKREAALKSLRECLG